MMRHITLSLFLFVVVSLLGCSQPGANPPQPTEQSVQLLLFSAPWCPKCQPEIQQIDALVKTELKEKAERLKTTVYVVSGASLAQKPTTQVVADYRTQLNVDFDVAPDPWRFQKYHAYYPELKPEVLLPAAVILKESGEKKVFRPGNFSPEEVLGHLEDALK